MRLRTLLRPFFFASKQRVRDLGEARITLLSPEDLIPEQEGEPRQGYLEARKLAEGLSWESLNFDRLCGLPAEVLAVLEL
jgi:hypothetical protein